MCAQLTQKGAPMLGFLFGFNARLGRLHFFLATIALAVVMTAICFLIAMSGGVHTPTVRTRPIFEQLTWPMLIAAGFFVVATLTLQSMRFRDIGWDPVCVIPAWFALLAVDELVATKMPAWSLGEGHNATIVGGLVNFGLLLALTFWPSGNYDCPSETPRTTDAPSPRPRTASVADARIARASGAQFGRRAF
jgi:uncharacterized membrane protein YhaH (DUF805 family)